MDSDDDNYDLAGFFATPELLISQSKNQAFGHPDTTTLLPLDRHTLEVICRVNLPGVPIMGSHVDDSFNNLGFDQLLTLDLGADFGSLHVRIIQCSSHLGALKAMKRLILHEDSWVEGHHSYRCEGLGNYAVEINHEDHDYERWIKLIWARWTTAIAIESSGFCGSEGNLNQRLVDVKRLASALDKAMIEHKGTTYQVPKVCINVNKWDIPQFKKEGQTESIQLTFDADTHPYRWFGVDGVFHAVFDVADGPTGSPTSSGGKELLVWQSYPYWRNNFRASGISLRCKELVHGGHARLTIKLAHKSSLWTTTRTFHLECSLPKSKISAK